MVMRRLTYLVCSVVFGMASAPTGCSNGDSSDGTSSWLCRVDDDCTAGLVCNEGTCVEPGDDDMPEAMPDAG